MENTEEIQYPMGLTNDDTREKANELLSQMEELVLTIRNLQTNGATHKEVNDVRERFTKATDDYIACMEELKKAKNE